jgi:hypothetical protein
MPRIEAAIMKLILGTFVALALFASTAFAQTPAVPIGPGGGGGGGGGGSGTVTSVATSCGVSGGPITTSGTITGNITANDAATGSAYTFLASDCGKLVSFSDGTARAPSLPSASFVAGNFINIVNTGAGVQTITPTAGTICGAATLALQQNQGDGITFDGTNWQCSGGPYAPVNSGTVPLARMPTVLGAPSYVTGASMWYRNPYTLSGGATSSVGAANSYYCAPFWIYQTVTIKALALTVATSSTGNSSAALQGAVYADLVTTANVHRPGTLVDYTANFATGTGSGTPVSAALNNTTDTLSGPAMYWTCVQKFDNVAAYVALAGSGSFVAAAIGSASLSNALYAGAGNNLEGVSTTGSAYGGTNWVNFTSSTSWTEQASTAVGPAMAIQVN